MRALLLLLALPSALCVPFTPLDASQASKDPLSLLARPPPLLATNQGGLNFSELVVFGDEWSDDGTGAWKLTNGTWPSDPHYFEHRFTNGLTWVERLAGFLNVSTTSYAVAGATTSNDLVQGSTGPARRTLVPSIAGQVDSYLSPAPDVTETLYILQGGMNDFLFGQFENVKGAESAGEFGKAMLKLAQYGAQYILLANLPNTLTYPYASSNPFAQKPLANFTLSFRDALSSFDEQRPNVAIVDFWALFSEIGDMGGLLGYEEGKLDEPCLVGVYEAADNVTVCSTPQSRVWWDEFNPTNTTHAYMATVAYNTLKENGWIS
ncbi:hypothetical protein JCM8097_000748 [Rhodosporidiobolus ruineniae]